MQNLWFDASTTVNEGDEPYTNLFLINLQGLWLSHSWLVCGQVASDVLSPSTVALIRKRMFNEAVHQSVGPYVMLL